MVKNALRLRHLTFCKVEVKLNQSENQLSKTAITLIFKEKNAVPSSHYFTNFKTDLRMWYQFVSWGLQKWQKKCAKRFAINLF